MNNSLLLPDLKKAKKAELIQFVHNTTALISRAVLTGAFGKQFNGARDLNTVLGYPETLDFQTLYSMYAREGIAARAGDGIAEECWRKAPILWDGSVEGDRSESADFTTQTDFLNGFREAAQRLDLFHHCLELDKMLAYSRYAVFY